MKILIKIWTIAVIALLSIQFFSLLVTVYLYQNHNEALTVSCCINKNTDPTCNAKCVLEKTEENQEETEELLKKEVALLFFQLEEKIKDSSCNFIDESTRTSFYENKYSFYFQNNAIKPPQNFIC